MLFGRSASCVRSRVLSPASSGCGLRPVPTRRHPLAARPVRTACPGRRPTGRVWRAGARGRCRGGPGPTAGPAGICGPPGSWRICSSCWRAANCWANSVAWMPWNRPSSQPTSCALAMRSSASLGTSPSLERQRQRRQFLLQVGRQRLGQLDDRAVVDLGQPLAADASSSGAARTSSSSCLTIEPMRITLAGDVTDSSLGRSASARSSAPSATHRLRDLAR